MVQTRNPIRILLIDDHRSMRAGLRLLLESQENLVVIGEAGTRAEALEAIKAETPDIILLDLDLGIEESGLDLLAELHKSTLEARVLVLTGLRDTAKHHEAVRMGAMGVVLKERAESELFKAIEKVYEGEMWLDRSTLGKIFAEMTSGSEKRSDLEIEKITTLTEREREVVRLIGEGLRNKQIADRLHISEATVRHHLTSIFSKLEVGDRLELVIYAYHHNLAKLSN